MYAKGLRPGAATPAQAQRSGPELAQFHVGVEMKIPSELLGRRLSGVPAVGGSLRFAQEVDRHGCPEKGIVFGERIGTDPMLLLWTESVHNISQ